MLKGGSWICDWSVRKRSGLETDIGLCRQYRKLTKITKQHVNKKCARSGPRACSNVTRLRRRRWPRKADQEEMKSEVEEETLEPSKEKTSRTPQPVFNLSNCYSSMIPTYSFTTMCDLLSFCLYCFLSIYCVFPFSSCPALFLPIVSCPRVKTTVRKEKKWNTQKPKATYSKYEHLLKIDIDLNEIILM